MMSIMTLMMITMTVVNEVKIATTSLLHQLARCVCSTTTTVTTTSTTTTKVLFSLVMKRHKYNTCTIHPFRQSREVVNR